MAGKQIPEMNYLMSLVERKYRKAVKTSTDFYTLAADIESKTKERVSPSTLKRMWGYVNMTPIPRQTTLDVLARYIGKDDYKTFCDDLKHTEAFHSRFFTADFINANDLKPEAGIEIGWSPDRMVTLKYLGDCQFEVTGSLNSKLAPGDRFVVANFIKGFPLYISRILRNGEYTPAYIAGRQGGSEAPTSRQKADSRAESMTHSLASLAGCRYPFRNGHRHRPGDPHVLRNLTLPREK